MNTVLDKVDALVAELNALLPYKPEDKKRLDKKFRLEFNYNSNHLEGNTLTYGETELLLIFDDTKGNHTLREYEEMKAHDAAYQLIEDWANDKERPLTEQNIKNLNEIILVRPFWKDAQTPDGQATRRKIEVGNYKGFPNSVRLQNGEIFENASPSETPKQMQALIDWYRDEENNSHPVTLAAMLHYKFVRIHPFDDGNGRISRLLVNYVLLRNGLPPIVIKSKDKTNYLRALHLADIGDYEPFINYIAEQLIWSLEISIKAAKGEGLEEVGDLEKEISLLTKKLLSENTETKHPAIIYKIYTWFNNSVWREVKTALSQFDPLFSEKKEFHAVNLLPESFEKRKLLDAPFMINEGSDKAKIFGRDIYETDIKQLDWSLIFYGLKGAKTKPDVEVKSELRFHLGSYDVNISTGTSFSKTTFKYGDFMLDSDREKMIASLSKGLLAEIKNRVNKE
jgi:Fic family protein